MALLCPNCRSGQLTALEDGLTNPLLEKGVHLFAGIIKSEKIILTCRSCGAVCKPGEAIVDNKSSDFAGTSDVIDRLLLETIKAISITGTIKSYKNLTGVKLGEAKHRVEKVAKDNGISLTAKTPPGCYIIVLVIALLLMGVASGIIKVFK